MKFKIPFTFSDIDILKRKVKKSSRAFEGMKNTKLGKELEKCRVNLNAPEYFSIVFRSLSVYFVLFLIVFSGIFFLSGVSDFYLYGPGATLLLLFFMFARQMSYPKMHASRKEKEIEKNLIPMLQDMLVQLDSGVSMYQILANISTTDYGEVSKEIKVAVNEINAGSSQIDALENLIAKSSSEYFKRVLWQISNGLRSGGDMNIVLKDGIENLNREQGIQIQSYGNKLNPLVMFYMLIAVIIPSLGLTFLIILSSMMDFSSQMVMIAFVGIGVFIVLVQVMFLGLIKTRRPSLL